MIKDTIKKYGLQVLLLIVLLFTLFVSTIPSKYFIALFLIGYMLVTRNVIKKKNIISAYEGRVCLFMLVSVVIYLMAFYILGLIFGFNRNVTVLSFKLMFTEIVPVGLIIIASEIIRYYLISQKGKISQILTLVGMVLIDLVIYKGVYNISALDGFLAQVGFIGFTAIANNLLYNYLTKRFGYKPALIYHLVITLYVYFMPVIPNLYIFFRTFLRMAYPYIIYLALDYMYSRETKMTSYRNNRVNIIKTTITFVGLVMIIMLVSCKFRFGILVIGSGSMTGALNKGDAIIFEAYHHQTIRENEIIVFRKKDINLVHRVVSINKVNGMVRYYTKGDANENQDDGYRTQNDIIGLTKIRIPYLGYPTLWIRSLFSHD